MPNEGGVCWFTIGDYGYKGNSQQKIVADQME